MKILKELSEAFSPSGFEEAAGSIIAAEMEKAGFTVSTDVLGSVLCHKEGTGKKLLLTAFFDEPGFMVTDAEEDGTLCLRPTGGESVDGDVRVVTESGRVGTLKKEGNKFTAFIGEGTKEAALITAPIGSYLVFYSALKEGEVLEGKALSSRSGAAALIAAAGFSVVRISLLQESAFQASGRFADLFFWKGLLLAAVIWVLTNVVKPTKKLHPIVYIAASAVVGIVFSFAGA